MKTMICLAVFAVTMSVAYANIGTYCSTVADCGDAANWDCGPATGCANGTCDCKTGMAGTACDKIEVGRTCTVATDTPNCHDSSTCEGVGDATEGKCTPPCTVDGETYNWDLMSCVADDPGYVKIDADCTLDTECAGGRAASGAVPTCFDDDSDDTTSKKCKCTDPDYQADSNMINCEKLAYDAECTGNEKCTSNVCTEGKCACPTGQERYLSTCVATGGTRDLDNGAVCMLDLTKTCDDDLACCPVVDSDPVSYVCMAEEEGGSGDTSGASAVSAVLFTIASAIMALLF